MNYMRKPTYILSDDCEIPYGVDTIWCETEIDVLYKRLLELASDAVLQQNIWIILPLDSIYDPKIRTLQTIPHLKFEDVRTTKENFLIQYKVSS